MQALELGGKQLSSRLFLGTGKFSSPEVMHEAVIASGSELVTVALKRVDRSAGREHDRLLSALRIPGVNLLPNTSGVRTAEEAILAAELAREAFETNWVKLEIHPDPRYLMPDPVETLQAARELVKRDFVVLPYIHADPALCKRLEDVGVAAVMPLAAPIGTNQGLTMRSMLEIIIAESRVPVVVDAGLGAPSHAAAALELGADAVLVNTAIASAGDAKQMAEAFRLAVTAGRTAYECGLGVVRNEAAATSPLHAFLQRASESV